MLHLTYTPVSPLLDFVDDFWLYDGARPEFASRRLAHHRRRRERYAADVFSVYDLS
jgi:hypothetical protein